MFLGGYVDPGEDIHKVALIHFNSRKKIKKNMKLSKCIIYTPARKSVKYYEFYIQAAVREVFEETGIESEFR